MIGIPDISLVFQAALCLVGLAFVLLKLSAEHRLDAFRQKLFAIRDELFDYASAGNIDFNDPAYRLLRRSMNGFIRYAHQLTFFRVCMTMAEVKLAGKAAEPKWTEEWPKSLQRIRDDNVRVALEHFHDRAMTCTARRLIFGSPVLLSLVLLSVPVLMVKLRIQNLTQILSRAPIFTLSHVVDTR